MRETPAFGEFMRAIEHALKRRNDYDRALRQEREPLIAHVRLDTAMERLKSKGRIAGTTPERMRAVESELARNGFDPLLCAPSPEEDQRYAAAMEGSDGEE